MSDDAKATALAGLTSRVGALQGELSRLRAILAEGAANGPPPPPPLVDPQCTKLSIGGDSGITPPEHSDQDGWSALGECIASHEHLRYLTFWGSDTTNESLEGIDTTNESLEALLTGVNQNRTVRELRFCCCRGEWPLGILEIFFRDNQNLSLLRMNMCRGEFISSLSAALGGCTSRSLQHVHCEGYEMGDTEDVTEFIEALAGLPQLKKLEFCECIVERRGCGAVAALLQSPACKLQEISIDYGSIDDEGLAVLETAVAASSTLTELSLLDMDCSAAALQSFSGVLRSPTCALKILNLCGNSIGDDTMISFADALVTNHRLEKLILACNHTIPTISDIGFAAMTRALCNTSSIGDVHSSNHTLQDLGLSGMPDNLEKYLRMNRGEDKSLVARQKIFMHFFKENFSMEPFHENAMAPKFLPHLLAWIGRTPDGESFTTLFNFLKRMPSLCGNCRPAFRHGGRKRKVGN